MNKEIAYRIVIKDLKKSTKCKEHCIGCFDCSIRRMVEDLESFYHMDIERAKDSYEEIKDIQKWKRKKNQKK